MIPARLTSMEANQKFPAVDEGREISPRIPGGLFIISAPSGGGKTTLIRSLLSQGEENSKHGLGGSLYFSVSHTTRSPRDGERDAVDYHFVSREAFDAMIRKAEFLEYALVHQNFYGTSKSEVLGKLEAGIDVILDIDVQGAKSIKESYPDSVGVFLLPPSPATLQARLRSRASDDEAAIERRLRRAIAEIDQYRDYDYAIINDRLEVSCNALRAIFLERRLRVAAQQSQIERLWHEFKAQEGSLR